MTSRQTQRRTIWQFYPKQRIIKIRPLHTRKRVQKYEFRLVAEIARTREKECQKYDMNLVTIGSLEEQKNIMEQLKMYEREPAVYWISLDRKDKKSGWRWKYPGKFLKISLNMMFRRTFPTFPDVHRLFSGLTH